MVLEFIEGRPLDALPIGGPSEALEIAIPIARALEHAHNLGIVHRDLKPENVIVSRSGLVKVLDFGIAKARDLTPETLGQPRRQRNRRSSGLTGIGAIVGTIPYMSPEQLRGEEIDGRSDVWALGLMLYELVVGSHPFGEPPNAQNGGMDRIADPNSPMPSVRESAPKLRSALASIIDRCLAKAPAERFDSAAELAEELENCRRSRARLADGECPFLGLRPFSNHHADRFYGRAPDIRRTIARLRDEPLVAIVGPTGIGKSSLVRAGVLPALGSTCNWRTITVRPGQRPLEALAMSIAGLDDTAGQASIETHADRLRDEPGSFGGALRASLGQSERIAVFVDQFEEIYTLVADEETRSAYVSALLAAADDVESPVRVLLSVRSDFVHRAAENRRFCEALSRAFVFLSPLDDGAIRQALERPASVAGYSLEKGLVTRMQAELKGVAGALPLLQFTAERFWDARDDENRQLTVASYDFMGGVAGALADHAERVLGDLPPAARTTARNTLVRLVTSEKTRAVVSVKELVEGSSDRETTRDLIERLAHARLLMIETGADNNESTVELVHESLITHWPQLARWVDEESDYGAYLARLRTASVRWSERGELRTLLWRDAELDEAHRFRRLFGERGAGERDRRFLRATFAKEARIKRRRGLRLAALAALISLAAIVAIVVVSLLAAAERDRREHAEKAQKEAERALLETQRAQEARLRADAERKNRKHAERIAKTATAKVSSAEEELRRANRELEAALASQRRVTEKARESKSKAVRESERAQAAEAKIREKQALLEKLLAEREAELERLARKRKQISEDLR